MEFTFVGEVWHWRGPSPYHFVTLPDDHADAIHARANEVTYGWGMIPVEVRVGDTAWRTSMYSKDGGYVLPLRDFVRRAEKIELGDDVEVHLTVISSS